MGFIVGDWACVAEANVVLALPIYGGWSPPLSECSVLLAPSEQIIAGWKMVDSCQVILSPSEQIIAGWKRLAEASASLVLSIACRTDVDCPEGYVCRDGVCVKMGGEFPWGLLVGGAAIAGIAVVASRKKKPPEKKGVKK